MKETKNVNGGNTKIMKKTLAILFLFLSVATVYVSAQTTGGQSQKQGGNVGTVTIRQSSAIDALVNGKKRAEVAAQEQAKAQAEAAAKAAEESVEKDDEPAPAPKKREVVRKHKPATIDDEENVIATSSAHVQKVTRGYSTVDGYRVQVFMGSDTRADREKAESIRDDIKKKYPDQPVFVHFYSPRWICRVGNFVDHKEATNFLKLMRKMGYAQACLVKGKIKL